MSEWIDVRDRLPTKENKFVVCLINKRPILCEVHEATFSLTKGQVSFYWPTKQWIKDECYSEVTHWMPLPSTDSIAEAPKDPPINENCPPGKIIIGGEKGTVKCSYDEMQIRYH